MITTPKRYRKKIQRVWTPTTKPTSTECNRYGCTRLPNTSVCTNCLSPLHVSGSPSAIKNELTRHFRKQFKQRPPLDTTLFASTPHPTNPECSTVRPHHSPSTTSLSPTQRIFQHIYSGPSPATAAHYSNIMETITAPEWEAYIQSTSNSAPGPTRFSYTLLKHSPPAVTDSLLRITNYCLQLQDVPALYKHTTLLPVAKKANSSLPNEFRPIALAEIGYKLLTGILTSRITKLGTIAPQPLFSDLQHGGVKGRSAEEALLSWYTILETSKATNSPLHVMYADVSAAYDSITTDSKTLSYWQAGMPPDFCNLMAALDQGANTSIVAPDNTTTDPLDLECGLRQGDPISPLSWILFLNPLLTWLQDGLPTAQPDSLSYTPTGDQAHYNGDHTRYPSAPCTGVSLPHIYSPSGTQHTASPVGCYMDDLAGGTTTYREMITLAERSSMFLDFHHVHFNPSKTHYQTNQPYSSPPAVLTQGTWQTVQHTPHTTPIRYLGVHFTLDLNWDHQIALLWKSTSLHLQLLRAKRATLPEALYAINAMLIPSLIYKLKFIPNGYSIADQLDHAITRAYSLANHSHGQALWSWYSPHQELGMQQVRVRERLLTEHMSLITLNLARPHADHEYTSLRSLFALHMRSEGYHVSPFFLPPSAHRPLSPHVHSCSMAQRTGPRPS